MRSDFVILADRADVVGDKLYLMGGGWSVLNAQAFPAAHQMGLAVGVMVEWLETNRKHTFTLEIRHEDGHEKLGSADGDFEIGRPPGIPEGVEQRFMIAMNVPVKVNGPGSYEVRLLLDGEQAARQTFLVRGPDSRQGRPTSPPPPA